MLDPVASPFSYAILRVVPSVERGERLNVGVVLFCRQRRFLGARFELDEVRLHAVAPGLQARDLGAHLEALGRVAEGAEGAGPIAQLPQSERFGWLLQKTLQQTIAARPLKELLVGEALILPTGDMEVPWLISAPTMRVPMRLVWTSCAESLLP